MHTCEKKKGQRPSVRRGGEMEKGGSHLCPPVSLRSVRPPFPPPSVRSFAFAFAFATPTHSLTHYRSDRRPENHHHQPPSLVFLRHRAMRPAAAWWVIVPSIHRAVHHSTTSSVAARDASYLSSIGGDERTRGGRRQHAHTHWQCGGGAPLFTLSLPASSL